MKKNNRTGSRLFFIEFLIVLFFFLIVSTVCLRLFARAHTITRRADALSHAQTAAAAAAAAIEEAVTGSCAQDPRAILDAAAVFLPDPVVSDEGLSVFYDEAFRPCAAEDAGYILTAAVQTAAQETTASIEVCDNRQTSVYTLTASFHRPLSGKEVLQ